MSTEIQEMPEGHLHLTDAEYADGKQDVLKTIIILSVVTVVEVSVAIGYDHFNPNGGSMRWLINLKAETRGFFLTVVLPFMFLIWAIIAFSYEGSSWHGMRDVVNAYNPLNIF